MTEQTEQATTLVLRDAVSGISEADAATLTRKWGELLQGVDASSFASSYTPTEVDAVGIVLAARELEREQDRLGNAEALGVYMVLNTYGHITAAELAEQIGGGVSKQRVSHLKQQGELFARFGITSQNDPMGKVSQSIRAAVQGKAGPGMTEALRAIADSKRKPEGKLAAVVSTVSKGRKAVEAKQAAGRKPRNMGGTEPTTTTDPTAGESKTDTPAPDDTHSDADRVAFHTAALVDALTFLGDHWNDGPKVITDAQRKLVVTNLTRVLGIAKERAEAKRTASSAKTA